MPAACRLRAACRRALRHETARHAVSVIFGYGYWYAHRAIIVHLRLTPLYNRQLFKSVELLQTINEFAAKQKPSQAQDITATRDLIELLTQHEEDIVKHLFQTVDWNSEKQASAYGFLDDPYHKLDAEDHIRKPVHVPHMTAYYLLGMVTETTAIMKGEEKALHTESTIWTSKHARATHSNPATSRSSSTSRSHSGSKTRSSYATSR